MNTEQKRAWFCVIVMTVCIVGFLVLWPFAGAKAAFGAFGLYGLTGFMGLIGRGEKMDERDRAIARRATLAGAMCSYEAFIIGCMGTWFFVYAWHRQTQIEVHVLGMITMLGGITFFFSRSVAILVYYGRKTEADNA